MLIPYCFADDSLREHEPSEAPAIVHQHLGGEVHIESRRDEYRLFLKDHCVGHCPKPSYMLYAILYWLDKEHEENEEKVLTDEEKHYLKYKTMKCRLMFQGGHGIHEDASDKYMSIIVNVPENIAKMCKEYGATYSRVVATEWLEEDK